MAKEKSPAYQRYPKDYLSDAKVQAMTIEEEGMYNRLMDYCWIEDSLPNDPEILKSLCKGKAPSPLVLSCFIAQRSHSDNLLVTLRHKRLDEERKKQAENRARMSLAGKIGNKKRWGKQKKIKKIIATGSHPCDEMRSQNVALQSSSSIASSVAVCGLQSSSPTAEDKSIAASQASPLTGSNQTPKKERPKDAAYETFCDEFARTRSVPYRGKAGKNGDFVQLAGLRRQLNIGSRETPDRWLVALGNYLQTPLSKYTLADLCSRFDVFVNAPLDRYGKPKQTDTMNQLTETEQTPEDRAALNQAIEARRQKGLDRF